jgi:hypothetical protein
VLAYLAYLAYLDLVAQVVALAGRLAPWLVGACPFAACPFAAWPEALAGDFGFCPTGLALPLSALVLPLRSSN